MEEMHLIKTQPKVFNILIDSVGAEGGVLCIRSHDIGHVGSKGPWRPVSPFTKMV